MSSEEIRRSLYVSLFLFLIFNLVASSVRHVLLAQPEKKKKKLEGD